MNKDSSQTVYNILSQLILNGTNFVLIMIFTRLLSTDHYGVVSIYQAYVLLLTVPVGLNTQGSIGTAFVHIDSENHRDYLASVFFLSLCAFAVILAAVWAVMPAFSSFSQLEPFLVNLMLFHSFGSFCFQFLSIRYIYSRKAQNSCRMALMIAVLMIVISWLGASHISPQMPEYMGRILGLSVPYIIFIFVAAAVIFRGADPFSEIKKYWSFCLPVCIPLIFHGISQVVLSQTDKIMLQKLLHDDGTVGIYSFFVTFVHILNSVYIALNNTWVPIFYECLKKRQTETVRVRSKRYLNLFTVLAVGFMLVAPEVVKLLADRAYWSGMPLIPVTAVSIYMVFLYSFAVNFELFHRKSKWIAIGTTAAAAFNILFNAVLIPRLGMYGAALGTLGAYTLLLLFHELCARYAVKDGVFPYGRGFFAANTAVMLLSAGTCYLFLDIWAVRWTLALAAAGYLLDMFRRNRSIF